MRITGQDRIAGYPATELRRFMRTIGGPAQVLRHAFTHFIIASRLNKLPSQPDNEQLKRMKLDAAEKTPALIEELTRQGFIEETEPGTWIRTLKGGALSLATARKPIRRETATKLVEGLIGRAKAVNESAQYLMYVKKITVFGSYLTDSPNLGDIDLVVELDRKIAHYDLYSFVAGAHTRLAKRNGRKFRGDMDTILWPKTEVENFLRGQSKALTFHSATLDSPEQISVRKTIFESRGPLLPDEEFCDQVALLNPLLRAAKELHDKLGDLPFIAYSKEKHSSFDGPIAYTAGLMLTRNHPEIIITEIPKESHSPAMRNILHTIMGTNLPFRTGKTYHGILPAGPCHFTTIKNKDIMRSFRKLDLLFGNRLRMLLLRPGPQGRRHGQPQKGRHIQGKKTSSKVDT